MKKILWIFLVGFLSSFSLYAQLHKTVRVPKSGELRAQFTEEEALTTTHLTLTGSINAIDFKVLRDEFPNLEFLDLTNVSIKLYAGKKGTFDDKTYVYPMECIPAYAFYNKESLKHIILSPSTKNIEDAAFLGCKNLKVCEIRKKKTPNLHDKALNDSITTIFVPLGSRDEYWNKNKWQPFNLVEGEVISVEINVSEPGTLDNEIRKTGKRPEEVNFLTIKGTLNEEDFKNIRDNMPKLTGIDLTSISNRDIPDFTFSHKKFLMWVEFPSNLESISDRAFSGCIRLSGELVLPETTQTVAEDAFSGCERVTSILLKGEEIKK